MSWCSATTTPPLVSPGALTILIATTLVLGIGILAAFVMEHFTAEAISAPIERLAEAAAGVEAGSYELDALAGVTTRTDKLGQFARAFEAMVQQVHGREQKLQAQVSALQIEIDQQKPAKEVEGIAETDFFRDLQTKADEIRANRGEQGGGKNV